MRERERERESVRELDDIELMKETLPKNIIP